MRTSGGISAMIVPAQMCRIGWNFSLRNARFCQAIEDFYATLNDECEFLGAG
jgi:hypothetical protein